MSPPIRPPDDFWWCSIPVWDLHVEDKFSGDIVLSFPRIDGTLPFIQLPLQVSLEIISHVGLPAIYDALLHCEKLRRVALSLEVTVNVSLPITVSTSHMRVLGHSHKKLQHCSWQSSTFRWCTPVWLMNRAETSFHAFIDQCVIQSSAPCKEPSRHSRQPGMSPLPFLQFFLVGLHLVWRYFFVVTQMPTSQRASHRSSSKEDLNITSTMMSSRISVFQPWECQFYFVQVITSCSMLSLHSVCCLDAQHGRWDYVHLRVFVDIDCWCAQQWPHK